MKSNDVSAADVRLSAMNLLALREHSKKELKDKLMRKYTQQELIDTVIARLVEQGLQSDERFAEAFINMRQNQGKGSVIIKMELRERGIASPLLTALVDEADGLWIQLAKEVRRKRFHQLPVDSRDKAKQMRFLHSRGFAGRHIQAAFADALDYE